MLPRSCYSFALAAVFCLPAFSASQRAVLNQYCAGCHNDKLMTGGVSVDHLKDDNVAEGAETWEKVLRKMSTGQMPPAGLPHPDAAASATFVNWLQTSLDQSAAAHPNPGRPAIHRLNRAEYGNAIRDLLALNYEAGASLPADDSGYGFDNIGDVLSVSPVLLERYMAAARKVSRLAVGDPHVVPAVEQYAVSRGIAQTDQVSEDLPLGSRGGTAIQHYFPVDAVYTLRVNLRPPPDSQSDDKPHFDLRIPVKAGSRTIGVTFLRETAMRETVAPPRAQRGTPPMPETPLPAQLDVRVDDARVKLFDVAWARPSVDSVLVGGPYEIEGAGDTPSRHRIFICHADTDTCAQKILSTLAHRAYRRPVTETDIRPLMNFYRTGRKGRNFDDGIELALRAMLVSPDFLFRVEHDPAAGAGGTPHTVNDVELASRLSFFLWSSIPDDELLSVAEQGKLHDQAVLEQQVHRMLADSRSKALITNFAGQWLYLRNLDKLTPDPDAFPEFDDGLRKCFQRETEMFLETVMREDRSVVDLLDANFTFVNERLAKFYGLPNVHGAAFRRVTLNDGKRGGLLGQGSILTVTSYPNRTSVVQRGKWVLENVLGTPPPPPPANVPDLKSHTEDGKLLNMRQQMEMHRANAICASCHSRMDPIGFALENFDGVGKWRNKDAGAPIDASGVMPDGTKFNGPGELRKALLVHKDEFVTALSGKLLTYALGRGLEYYDQPTVRSIAREASQDDYRFSAIVTAIVKSTPFQMRRKPES